MTTQPDGELERAALVIDPYHMGERKARKYVDELASRLGIKVPQGSAYSQDVLFQFEGAMLKLNFQSLVDETRKTGVPRDLQDILDLRDPFLSPVTQRFAVGVLPGNLISSYKVTYGEYTKTVELPGSAEAPNESLANDILTYRAAVSENSRTIGCEEYARYYRAYLQSCVSLVDCFISRYLFEIKRRVGDVSAFENTKILGSRSGIEKRVEAWVTTFAFDKLKEYRGTLEWKAFQELRLERNSIVHPDEPVKAYSLREMAIHLNQCQDGVGGLLDNFRQYTGIKTPIGFLQKLKTAPKIRFVG